MEISGIISRNFGQERLVGFKRQGLYHGKCCVQAADNKFPVLTCSDLDNSLLNEDVLESDYLRHFKEGRDGDQFMIPFQCNVCHFLNIQKQFPVDGNAVDDLLMMFICRVNAWRSEK